MTAEHPVTPELQCIHRAGCPKPNVCREVGHCTSMTASDLTKHREESASAPAGPREKALLTSNQCTKGHLRLFECAGLPEGKYIERRDCLLCEIERLQRERDIWLRGFVREAYPAGPPDLRSHFSDPETRQGITDRDIQAMQAVIDRLYKNRERSLSDEGTQPDETTPERNALNMAYELLCISLAFLPDPDFEPNEDREINLRQARDRIAAWLAVTDYTVDHSPVKATANVSRTGAWMCECGQHNPDWEDNCGQCERKPPP